MTASIPDIRALFSQALEWDSPSDRARYLAKMCGDNAALRIEVESLLRALDKAGSFLEGPAPALGDTGTSPAESEGPGTLIGSYALLQTIGEGGMGTVYLAQQTEPVQRQVALKIVKPGMDSKQIIARFEAERQALALMDHPHIAKVFDAGTTASGRPYFVMELVSGQPITQYCDEHRLTPRQRLELFMPVCQAIQHAHHKGIIHRDIKPSNVLVALYDDRPVIKVIDFGIAKATGQRLTARTLFTEFGAVVGTLEYMSPEQAELNIQDIDTRSDIYSLGVLLYELLTGTTPLTRERLKQAALLEMLRLIREEEPPKPSTRLSTTAELPSVAANRGLAPKQLSGLVRGELDWIVMKSLEKDRNRRYETANGLARDIERYLQDEPVQACPPSAGYRFRKFARRNKRLLATGALLGVILLTAVGTIGWAVRDRAIRQTTIDQEAAAALAEAARALEGKDFPAALSAAKRAEGILAGGGSTEMRERSKGIRRDVEMVLRLEEARSAKVGDGFSRKVDTAGQDRAYAEAFADHGIDVDVLGPEAAAAPVGGSRIRIELATALDDWAHARRSLAKQATGRPWRELAAAARLADPEPFRSRVREVLERADPVELRELAQDERSLNLPPVLVNLLAEQLGQIGERDAAIRLLKKAREQHPSDFWLNYYTALNLNAYQSGDSGAALPYYVAAHALRPEHPMVLWRYAEVLEWLRRYDEAITVGRALLRLDLSETFTRCRISMCLLKRGQVDEGLAALDELYRLAPASADYYRSMFVWSLAQYPEDAQLIDTRLLVEAARKAVENDPTNDTARVMLGWAQYRAGDYRACIDTLETSPQKVHRTMDGPSRWLFMAMAHARLGNEAAAKRYFDQSAQHLELNTPHDKAYRRMAKDVAAVLKLGEPTDLDAAINAHQKAVAARPDDAAARVALGRALLLRKSAAEAENEFRAAIRLKPESGDAHLGLGTALDQQGKFPEAAAAYQEAARRYYAALAFDRDEAAAAEFACRQALRLKPGDAETHYRLGRVLVRLDRLPDAESAFRQALHLQPDWIEARDGLIEVLVRQGKQSAVTALQREQDLRSRLRTKPKDIEARYQLATTLMIQRRWPEAVAEFREVLRFEPDHPAARSALVGALVSQKKMVDAEAVLREPLTRNPNSPALLMQLGIFLCDRKRDYDGAIAAFREAIRREPEKAESHRNLGNALRGKGRLDEAIAAYQEAIRLQPDFAVAYYSLGLAHYQAKDWKATIQTLNTAVRLSREKDLGRSACFLALAHWQLGNKDEARRWYDQAVRWFDHHAPQEKGWQRLREAEKLLDIKNK